MAADQIPGFLSRLSIVKQLEILLGDEPVLDKPLPVDQSLPKVPSNQYDHHVFGLACLEKRQRFEQLIESAESSGKGDQALWRGSGSAFS